MTQQTPWMALPRGSGLVSVSSISLRSRSTAAPHQIVLIPCNEAAQMMRGGASSSPSVMSLGGGDVDGLAVEDKGELADRGGAGLAQRGGIVALAELRVGHEQR